MPWNNQGGGGPWGGGGGGQGPWGRGSSGGGGGGMRPPNLEEIIRQGQDRFRRLMPGGFGGGRGIAIVVGVLVLILLASGFYRVLPDEQGVVMRFGEFVKTTQPGLNYHLPTPIESVLTPKVTRVNRVEIGFRAAETTRGGAPRQIPEESLMLTGDENIVDINFTVFWVIRNAGEFLFNVRGPEQTVKAAAESAVRESIGQIPIALALAEGRRDIEQNTLRLLQEILNTYGAGILVTQVQLQKVDPPGPVIDAFRDVQRARADQERLRNEAEAYRNDIIPRARGEAERLVQESEAYKAEVVARSQGDAQRFLSVYAAYRVAPDVTKERIYIETIEEVLRNVNKVLIDKEGGSGVVPYLPLPEVARRTGQAPPPAPGTTSRTPTGGTRP